jgi:2,4-dienoyl-CoA reductase-like NADH-dependent reductase (Old Yellow Enzyme family)
MNQREDAYGGVPENRVRFHAELLTAVKGAVGADIPVGMRIAQLAVNNFANQWSGGANDAAVIFSAMQAAGADYLHVNSVPAVQPVFGGDETLAAHARKYYTGPIVACGGLGQPDAADTFLASGDADFAALARGALADPAWPNKVASGDAPRPFDPGMTQPLATLDNTDAWRAANSG